MQQENKMDNMAMIRSLLVFTLAFSVAGCIAQRPLIVQRTEDFPLSCDNQLNWKKAHWTALDPNREDRRRTDVKLLYSATGIYFLFRNEDSMISATMQNDFDSLWREDVAEVFLWPDTTRDFYFEYEISPLNKELALLIGGKTSKRTRWQPWPQTSDNRVLHCTKIVRNKEWYASFFIPFALMHPLVDGPPKKGTVWRANFYRCDSDPGARAEWSWKQTAKSFHELESFGRLEFQ